MTEKEEGGEARGEGEKADNEGYFCRPHSSGKYYYDHYVEAARSIEYVIRETLQINEVLPFSPFSLIFVKRVSLTG